MKNYWKKWVRITGLLTRQIQEKRVCIEAYDWCKQPNHEWVYAGKSDTTHSINSL